MRRSLDVAEVRLTLSRERSRQRYQDRLGLLQLLVVGRRGDAPRLDVRREILRRDVADVAVPVVQRLDELGNDVEHEHPAAYIRKRL